MARKHKHPEHENLERWLVSYADFITLLFATFTALYAIATAKLTETSDFSHSLSKGFQQQSLLKGIASILRGENTPSAKASPAFQTETGKGDGVMGMYDSLTYSEGERMAIEALAQELQAAAEQIEQEVEALNEEQAANPLDALLNPDKAEPLWGLEVSVQERGIRISMDSRLLFPPASAKLTPYAAQFLKQVAPRLLQRLPQHLIHVEGHTDSGAINTAQFPSNWELSTARAAVVVRHLVQKHGFAPRNMAAVGYADTRPLQPNTTPKGRAKNRRIDLIVLSRLAEERSDPVNQSRKEHNLLVAHKQETAPAVAAPTPRADEKISLSPPIESQVIAPVRVQAPKVAPKLLRQAATQEDPALVQAMDVK
jgi:chemotaxis protein MotB